MSIIKNILCGIVIGIANIIPGVSGGTMMVVLDVFDRIVGAIGGLRKNWKKNIPFLLEILLGAAAGIILFSKLLSYLLETRYMVTNFFFIGVILGSIPLVYRRATADRLKQGHLLFCCLTLILMLCTVYAVPGTPDTLIREVSWLSALRLFASGALAAVCMIIPGISGSFVLLLFGAYETIAVAIAEWNFAVLLPVGIGIVAGLLLGCKAIAVLLRRYPQATYFSILGFVIGSIPAIVEKIRQEQAFVGGGSLWIAIGVLLFGMALSYLFSNEGIKEKIRTHVLHRRKKRSEKAE